MCSTDLTVIVDKCRETLVVEGTWIFETLFTLETPGIL